MRSTNRGMTLLEILVAFVILSLTMAVILQIFSGGMRNSRVAERYSKAVFLAQSRMATVGLEQPLVVGEDSGQAGGDMQWRVSVSPLDDGGEADKLLMAVRQFQVRVTVSWNEDGHDKQIELSTVRLGPRV